MLFAFKQSRDLLYICCSCVRLDSYDVLRSQDQGQYRHRISDCSNAGGGKEPALNIRGFHGSGHLSRVGSGRVGSGRVGSGRVRSTRGIRNLLDPPREILNTCSDPTRLTPRNSIGLLTRPAGRVVIRENAEKHGPVLEPRGETQGRLSARRCGSLLLCCYSWACGVIVRNGSGIISGN